MPITTRIYKAPDDLQAVLDLLQAVRDVPNIVDMQELLDMPTMQAQTRLWEDADGRLLGFALVDPYHNLIFEVRPEAAALVSDMVAWGETCIRREMAETGEEFTLDASCRAADTTRIAWLENHGFVQQEMRSLHLVRPLNEPIPEPRLPAGFVIRPTTEAEAEAHVALHRAAFGSGFMTLEQRLATLRLPEYDPTLDLVVVAPDGTLAAYCTCSISAEENALNGRADGYTDPVATHPAYQRRGLARALLLTGMRLLRDRGMDFAVMGTSSENVAMQKTAESVGFRVVSENVWFAKAVDGRR
ncbi:MAG TPA: N-acetyltransferase [Anaerolineae bacterium]|nr:N-acetyltransferase [Anaerolineae bacterium]